MSREGAGEDKVNWMFVGLEKMDPNLDIFCERHK